MGDEMESTRALPALSDVDSAINANDRTEWATNNAFFVFISISSSFECSGLVAMEQQEQIRTYNPRGTPPSWQVLNPSGALKSLGGVRIRDNMNAESVSKRVHYSVLSPRVPSVSPLPKMPPI
jgi:hypothetical protein